MIGSAVARRLAVAGAGRILVVERAAAGAEASGAAAGLLAVASSRAPGGAIFELRRRSAAMFPGLVEELRAESGIDVGYSTNGLLDLAFTAGEEEALAALVERRRTQGFAAELLRGRAVRRLEAGVDPAVRCGAFFADDRSIDSRRLVQALSAGAASHGVEFRFGAALERVEASRGRVLAVEAGGERIAPGHLVIAAGLGSSAIGGLLGVRIPVKPDRGEMLALRPAVPLGRPLTWNEGCLVPQPNGEVLVGSTSARGEAEKKVSAASLALLVERAVRMVPGLGAAAVSRMWAGIRPMSTLRRPIVAPLGGFENVTLATGHHRAGILLAPITAALVSEMVLGLEPSMPLAPFSYRPR